MHETRTRSPSLNVVTAAPVSTTTPTASCPRIVPGVTSGTSPFRMCRSVPQMVEEVIRTIASVGASITGSGTDSQLFWPGPWYTSAFISGPPPVEWSFVEMLAAAGGAGIGESAERVADKPRRGLLEPSSHQGAALA